MTDTPGRYDGLPDRWPEPVLELYASVDESRELDAVESEALYQVCELLASAEANADRIATDGRMIVARDGNLVKHPLITEERLARSAALAALAKLAPEQDGAANPSAAGRAMVRQRWDKRRFGAAR